MNFGQFIFYTFLGASIWNVVLALLGYIAHGQMDLIHEYSHELSIAIMALIGVVIVYFATKTVVKKLKGEGKN
jgi:membrane protein DedA with SNARE-associated domain